MEEKRNAEEIKERIKENFEMMEECQIMLEEIDLISNIIQKEKNNEN